MTWYLKLGQKYRRLGFRWRWYCLSERLTGVTLGPLEADWHHGARHLEIGRLGWRLTIGRVDSHWHGARVLLFAVRNRRIRHWGWGIALHEPVFRTPA